MQKFSKLRSTRSVLVLDYSSSHMQLMAGHVCNLIINIVLCELIQIH